MYSYQELKKDLFTEHGQIVFLKVRDKAHKLLTDAGAFKVDRILSTVAGDSWLVLACLDRLVELGEIKEAVYEADVWSQHRVYTQYKINQL